MFGQPTLTVEGYSCAIRYAGYYYDSETGEYYLNNRYYDSSTGRFTTEDEASYGDDTDPDSLNLYSYCENDPIQYSDPTGHSPSLSNMTSAQLNTYFHSTSGYVENNAIAQSYNFSSALAMVGAYATAETINNAHSGSTVTAQQVNYQVQSGSTAIYYAVNGSSPAIQAGAISAITHDIAIPNPSIVALQNSAAQHTQYIPKPVDQKELLDPTVTTYSLYDNKQYNARLSQVGSSAGTLLWNSTPDQTERAIIALKLLGVNVDKGYGADWCTPAYVLRWLRDGKGKNVLNESSNRLENQAMQVVLDALGFQASKDWSMDNSFGSYMIGAVRATMAFNGQGWQGNEGGSDSDIGPNVGASIEKMLLGLVYAKDIGSVRAMYNAEQQWQVSKYEGWEQQAQEQARLEAIAAKLTAMQANPGANANGMVQPSIFPTFDQIDWDNVKFLDDPQYKLDPEMVEQTKKFYAWLNSTEGAKIIQGIKMVAQSPEMQQLLRASANAVATGANALDNVTMALWNEAGIVAEIPVAFTYSGEVILKGTSKALAAVAEKCGNLAIKQVTFAETLVTGERGSLGIYKAGEETVSTTSGFYHSANPNVIELIQQNGFRTDLPNPQASFLNNRFGNGVYVADSPSAVLAERPGGTVFQVDADIGRNLNVTDRGIIDYDMGHAIARGAKKHGFDSVTFNSAQPGGGINTIIFDPTRVTVKEVMP